VASFTPFSLIIYVRHAIILLLPSWITRMVVIPTVFAQHCSCVPCSNALSVHADALLLTYIFLSPIVDRCLPVWVARDKVTTFSTSGSQPTSTLESFGFASAEYVHPLLCVMFKCGTGTVHRGWRAALHESVTPPKHSSFHTTVVDRVVGSGPAGLWLIGCAPLAMARGRDV